MSTPPRTHRPGPVPPPRLRRGFTVMEVSVTIIIIVMLTSLVMVAVHRAMDGARKDQERQILVAMKKAVTQFENEFRFLPPLVDDTNPVLLNPRYNTNQPKVLTDQELTGFAAGNPVNPEKRFSAMSLTYYLMGACDVDPAPVDGARGTGFTAPRADGSFTQKGKSYEPFFDVAAAGNSRRFDSAGSRVVFKDRWGSPFVYVRWEPVPANPAAAAGSPDLKPRTLIPRMAGAGKDPRENPKLRGARYALVSFGPDRTTDTGAPLEVGTTAAPGVPLDSSLNDDIVEAEE